jgi:hypothetical protein
MASAIVGSPRWVCHSVIGNFEGDGDRATTNAIVNHLQIDPAERVAPEELTPQSFMDDWIPYWWLRDDGQH